jgi:hypothetical protein
MLINSIMPYIDLVMAFTMPKVFQILDGNDKTRTKKTSMAAYKKLWGGSDYFIHFKYS